MRSDPRGENVDKGNGKLAFDSVSLMTVLLCMMSDGAISVFPQHCNQPFDQACK